MRPPDGTFVGQGAVRQLDAQKTVTTLVEPPGLREGEVDRSRCCSYTADLTTDLAGNLHIVDTFGKQVWFFNRGSTAVIVHAVTVPPGGPAPVAGAARGGSQKEGVKALQAQMLNPHGIAVDVSGNLDIADTLESSVSRVDPAGTLSTVAGTGSAGFNGDGLNAQLTSLNQPQDPTVDVCGNLLIADPRNERVRRLTLVAPYRPVGQPASSTTTTSGRLGEAAARASAVGSVILAGWVTRRRRRVTHSRAGGHSRRGT